MTTALGHSSIEEQLGAGQLDVSFDWPVSRLGRADGLPTGQVHDLAFDADGRLWMATPNGLARYDGSRVVTFSRSDGLSTHGLRCVRVAPDGVVWIGSDVGIDRLMPDGTIERVCDGWKWGLANDIAIDPQGTVWVASAGGIIRWDLESSWVRDEDPLTATSPIHSVCLNRAGQVWISSRQFGVLVRTEAGWASPAVDVRSMVGTVLCLGPSSDGSMLVGGSEGVANIDETGRIVKSIPRMRIAVHAACAVDGELWLGAGERLLRLLATDTEWDDTSVVIDGTRVNRIDIDDHGNVWAASDAEGVAKIEALRHAIQCPELPVGAVFAVRPARSGGFLVAGDRLSGFYESGDSTTFRPIAALVGKRVWDIWDAGDGVIWAAAETGLVKIIDGVGTRLHPDHPVLGAPARVLLDRGDGLWVGTLNGLARINPDGSVSTILDDTGKSLGYVYTLQRDGDEVWIGTLGNGLWLSRQSELVRIVDDALTTTGNTYAVAVLGDAPVVVLQDDRAVTIDREGTVSLLATSSGPVMGWSAALDERGSLWVGGSDGLSEYNVRSGDLRQKITLSKCVGGWEFTTSRSLVIGNDGMIMCGLNSGLALVDSDDLAEIAGHTPTVRLNSLKWSNVEPSVTGDGSFIVPRGRWTVEASVFCTSAFDQAARLFRYRMLGFEREWSEPTTSAHIQFSSLPPGSYTLEAQAHSTIGGWGGATTLGVLEVRRPRSLSVWTRERQSTKRLRRLTGENHTLEQRVRERTIELTEARDQLDRANQALSSLSNTDPLTDVANRRHFDEQMRTGLENVERTDAPMSLLLADIDHFKAYNDHFGHLEGDECLRQVAVAMRRSVRNEGDLLARFGGEEFALLLPSTDMATAVQIAERLREEVERSALTHPQSPIADVVTVSIGVATLDGGTSATSSDLVGEADRALYAAKRSGRNCCRASTPAS